MEDRTKCDENNIDVFQNRCLRRILKIRRQAKITNKEVMEMAKMENLSEDVRKRRWKFIGHFMAKGYDNGWRTAMTWTPEGRRRRGVEPGQHKGEQQKRREKELDGGAGARCPLQRPTELVGDSVLTPYAPISARKLGEGEQILLC